VTQLAATMTHLGATMTRLGVMVAHLGVTMPPPHALPRPPIAPPPTALRGWFNVRHSNGGGGGLHKGGVFQRGGIKLGVSSTAHTNTPPAHNRANG